MGPAAAKCKDLFGPAGLARNGLPCEVRASSAPSKLLTIRNDYYIVFDMINELIGDPGFDVYHRKSREHGLKITPQRTAIFEELLKAKDHPSAEDIYKKIVKKIPNVSLDTVNRTLVTFAKIGMIRVVEGYGQAKRYDPDLGSHHHFRCVNCGRIIDFHNEAYDRLAVPADITRQFKVTGKKVVLEGLCGRCNRG